MSVDLSNKSVLVIDQGLYCSLAERLARDFGRTLYFSEWRSAFPRLRDAAVGEGLPGVERVYDLWDAIEKADLVAFPDTGFADLQQYLRRKGHRVWGAGAAEWLELDRSACRNLQREIGVAAPETVAVKGLGALRDLLAQADGPRWIKVSTFRGDMESFRHESMFSSEPWLDDLAARYGPLGESAEFLVESSVDGLEIAYDCFTVDGKFPSPALWGIEIKDLGYLGVVQPYDQLPQQVRDVNAKFAPVLAKDRCRSAVSFEMRVTADGTPVVIDPCVRCGSPCTEAWSELWVNLAEIFWEGAAGRLITPVPAAKYVALAMIRSEWALTHWTPVNIPPDVRRFVKLKNWTVVGGRDYFVPQGQEMPQIGAVIGLGDSVEAAMAQVDAVAGRVEGFQIDIPGHALDKALETVEEARRLGIDFGGVMHAGVSEEAVRRHEGRAAGEAVARNRAGPGRSGQSRPGRGRPQ